MTVYKNNKKSFLKKQDPLFWLCVVLPTALLAIYYGFIASNQYVSESRFVIRSPNKQSTSGLSVMLQNIGFNASSDDSYLVRDYMTSRDAVANLNNDLQIKDSFSSDTIDPFSRFGSFFQSPTDENFYKYFNDKVKIVYDPASSISQLRVQAFSAEEAQKINEHLLKMADVVINRINNNAKNDILNYAAEEVELAKQKSREAANRLAQYRTDNRLYNPEGQSTIALQEISKLQDALIQAQSQLAQAKALTPENPQIQPLEVHIKTIEKSIAEKTAKVTGPSDVSYSNRSVEYQGLQFEKQLADKQLEAAISRYESAKSDFNQKQLYLELLAQPSLPDEAAKPERFKNVLSGFVFGLLLWGVLRLFVAGVREHRD